MKFGNEIRQIREFLEDKSIKYKKFNWDGKNLSIYFHNGNCSKYDRSALEKMALAEKYKNPDKKLLLSFLPKKSGDPYIKIDEHDNKTRLAISTWVRKLSNADSVKYKWEYDIDNDLVVISNEDSVVYEFTMKDLRNLALKGEKELSYLVESHKSLIKNLIENKLEEKWDISTIAAK